MITMDFTFACVISFGSNEIPLETVVAMTVNAAAEKQPAETPIPTEQDHEMEDQDKEEEDKGPAPTPSKTPCPATALIF